MKKEQLHELLCQALETEMGGVEIHETALSLALNANLRKEWEYLERPRRHVEILATAWGKLESLGLPAVLPPPEEKRDVKTAIGAARAKRARTEISRAA